MAVAKVFKSINKIRQEASHPHSAIISPDNKYIFVQDLGSDKIWLHSMSKIKSELSDKNSHLLTVDSSVDLSPGSGPRHLIFHQTLPFAYLITELTSTVCVFIYDDKFGSLILIDKIDSLPSN